MGSGVEKRGFSQLLYTILVVVVGRKSCCFLMGTVMLPLLVSVIFFHVYKKKINRPIVANNNIVETNLRAFSYEELVQAINGFKDELGRGAFSLVYKGVIDIGGTRSNVAIKKLDRVVQDGEKEFRAELNVIAHTHHKNLVRLLGFCDDGENHLLVYEYVKNGTIASFLFGDTKPKRKLEALVENDIEALNDMKIFGRFVMVGIWCIQEDPFLRPNMRKVIQMLEGVVEVTPPPCPSPFSTITMGSEK
ncbi:hypothetical protein LguiB_001580 [Lonicera macranthoides]